ncbi:MAG TPA: choice-of-anchor J domain-containing protein, partial [Bacteroidia bacterium]|nr:choice-of-anchor J domain-containing protein [Bacteroidia bacterium]
MKKTLLLFSCSLLTICSFLVTQAQNRQSDPKRDKSNPTNLRVQAAINGTGTQKNAPSQMLTTALSGIYVEGFEGTFPPAGWQVIDVQDPTYMWAQSAVAPLEGTQSAYMSYTTTIGVTGEDWLIMPQFSVISTDSLSFYLRPEFLPYPPDTTLILVSTTDSSLSSFTTVLGTLAEGLNYPVTQTYGYYTFSLSAFAGQDIYVAFVNINDYGDGIYIDKVTIGTKPAADVTSASIDVPTYTASGVSQLPLATVFNNGSVAQTFDVTMTITGGYTSTKTVTSLAASSSQQVTFDPWIPAAGLATISIQTLLVGDVNPADDTLSQVTNVLEPFVNFGWISKAALPLTCYDPASAAINTNDTSYLFHVSGATLNGIVVDANRYANFSNNW